MLSELLFETTLPQKRSAIITPEGSTTWDELREQAQKAFALAKNLANRRVGVSLHPKANSYALIAALARLSSDVFLMDSQLSFQHSRLLAEGMRLGVLVTVKDSAPSGDLEFHELAGEAVGSSESTLTILTSGSSGEPKAVRHSWDSLSRPIRKSAQDHAPIWLLTYRPQLYAGLQVMLQCFADRGTLVIPRPEMDPTAIAKLMADARVQFVSATPSYWRRLIMFASPEVLTTIPLVQITLGGEVVDQAILDSLHQRFPKARLVHIYATTELGKCFSVSDRIAGFPTSFLEGNVHDNCRLRVSDGELLVCSQNSMRTYGPLVSEQASGSEWFATGDLVELRESRVYFSGRKSDVINVAGSKVYPIEIERVIRTVPGVSDVRVFGKASSIAGELVACEIVTENDQNQEELKKTVIDICRSTLTSYQVPRVIRFTNQIDMSSAGKTLRSKTG